MVNLEDYGKRVIIESIGLKHWTLVFIDALLRYLVAVIDFALDC